MGFPDMRIPISYALYYPEVKINNLPRFGLANQSLSFYDPDLQKFPSIQMAYDAIERKKEAALRRANEQAVEKFINGEIEFNQIFDFVQTHTF